MLSETLPTGDSGPSLSTAPGTALSVRAGIARLTLQLRALLQEAVAAEAEVANADEQEACDELRGRLEPLMAERRRILEETLQAAREDAAAQVSAAHRDAAALLTPVAVPVVDVPVVDAFLPVVFVPEAFEVQRLRLEGEIQTAKTRAAAARERTTIKDAEMQAALNSELIAGRDALAVIEHEYELAITIVRQRAQAEVERILLASGVQASDGHATTRIGDIIDPEGNVDDAR